MRVLTLIAALAVVLMGRGAAWSADFLYVPLNNDTVVRYNVELSSAIDVQNSAYLFASTNLTSPNSVAIDSSNNIYVVNLGRDQTPSSVSKFNSSGVYQGSILGHMSNPVGIAIDSSNNVFVSNQTIPGSISKFNSSGVYQPNGSISDPTQVYFNIPAGLAFNSSGNLYVANYGYGHVTVFDSSGNYQRLINSEYLRRCTGIAFDPSGNLYVANGGTTNTVAIFDSSGNYQRSISGNLNPAGLAFDSSGNLYVANYDSKTISKFDSSGAFQFSWSTGSAAPRRIASVPEHSTYALGGIGAMVLGVLARRRRRTALT